MKNKKLTYVLLPFVGLIWILVFIRIFNFHSTEETITLTDSKTKEQGKVELELTNYVLMANYPDPFLKRKRNPRSNNLSLASGSSKNTFDSKQGDELRKNIKSNEMEVKAQKDTINWPILKYKGVIINKKNQKRVGLIYYEGKEKICNLLDSIVQFQVASFNNDSLIIKFGDQHKVYERN